ncbi:MAG TPA: FAD-dependent oxidoreductase [Micromonosporaceae bacterium]
MELSRAVGRLLGVRAIDVPSRPGAARVAAGTSAVVVGGGIAGMSAAVVLAERRVAVTVLEAEARLGGRLSAQPVTLPDGSRHAVDHGFHAFFRQYYNWRAILRRIDQRLAMLRPIPGYPVISADWPEEEFGRLPPAPPLNLLALVARSPSLRLRHLREMDGAAALALLAYDPDATYRELDEVSATDLLDSLRLPDRARAMLFEVFAHSFFNHERDMSAAELVASFHFYFLGNPEGLGFDAPFRDYDTAIWRPLAGYVRQHGGRVQTEARVTTVKQTVGGWAVGTAEGPEYAAPYLVLAVDPPALRDLVSAAPDLAAVGPDLASRAGALPAGPPYAVARFWFDRDVAAGRPIFSGVSRQPTLDSVTLYHRLETGARDWARRTGGAVVELHAYACPDSMPAPEVAERMRRELAALWPETPNTPVHLHARVQAQAPSFDRGRAGRRPGVVTDADGVYLAGDGIATELPSALMERAAVTGILAANAILARAGATTEPLRSVPPRGMLAGRGRRPASADLAGEAPSS